MIRLFLLMISILPPFSDSKPFDNYVLVDNPTVYNEVNYTVTEYYDLGPQRAPGDNASGTASATVDGVTVSVRWEVSSVAFGIVVWHITYSDGTSEDFYGSFGNAKKHAQEIASQKAEEEAKRSTSSLPIGDGLCFMIILGSTYFLIKSEFLKHFI